MYLPNMLLATFHKYDLCKIPGLQKSWRLQLTYSLYMYKQDQSTFLIDEGGMSCSLYLELSKNGCHLVLRRDKPIDGNKNIWFITIRGTAISHKKLSILILTYAMLRMNFPLVSREYSFFPVSTPKIFTFPTWLPVARYWESGEKARDQASTILKRKKSVSWMLFLVLIQQCQFCMHQFRHLTP